MPYGLSFNQCRGKPVTVRRKLLNSCREPRDEAKRRFPKLLERLSDCGQRRHGWRGEGLIVMEKAAPLLGRGFLNMSIVYALKF